MDVLTVKDRLDAPAGIVTVEGTLAAVLLLESVMTAPPEGAGLLKNTVPLEDSRPPTTLDGLRLSEERMGKGGVTVSEADLLTPP
jgi:hypothetical protein